MHILPPHILRAIVERGTRLQREAAARTLALDATFRSLRIAPSSRRPITPEPPARSTADDLLGGHRQDLAGAVVATEQDPPAASRDAAVREAFDGLGATWDFFREVFDRDSIDDEGMRLDATVHYAERYNNAFWNGTQMVFGDGDGEIFNRFTASVDVIGHELAHGVTDDEAGLAYHVPAGRAQRVHVGRVRVAREADSDAPDRRARPTGWLARDCSRRRCMRARSGR